MKLGSNSYIWTARNSCLKEQVQASMYMHEIIWVNKSFEPAYWTLKPTWFQEMGNSSYVTPKYWCLANIQSLLKIVIIHLPLVHLPLSSLSYASSGWLDMSTRPLISSEPGLVWIHRIGKVPRTVAFEVCFISLPLSLSVSPFAQPIHLNLPLLFCDSSNVYFCCLFILLFVVLGTQS